MDLNVQDPTDIHKDVTLTPVGVGQLTFPKSQNRTRSRCNSILKIGLYNIQYKLHPYLNQKEVFSTENK